MDSRALDDVATACSVSVKEASCVVHNSKHEEEACRLITHGSSMAEYVDTRPNSKTENTNQKGFDQQFDQSDP